MIPKVCFICGEEHPRRKTKRYVVRRPGKPAVERAVELCSEHAAPFEKILSSPARGTRHRLKAYRSFSAFQREAKG